MSLVSATGRRRLPVVLSAALVVVGSAMSPAPVAAADDWRLPAPVLVAPAPYATSSATPVFEWQAVQGAVKYDVDVRSVPTGFFPTCGGQVYALRVTCGDLAPGPYLWTVSAVGPQNRTGRPATARVFVKSPRLTSAPTLTAPPSGTTFGYPHNLGVLRWSAVPYAAYYQVQIASSPTFPGPAPNIAVANLTTEAMVIPPDVIGTTRYWRVRAVTASKLYAGPWSSARSFKVTWGAAPELTSPPDGATVSNLDLLWEPLEGARKYEIQMANPEDPSFADPIYTNDTFKPWFNLPVFPVDTFLWRVRALNGADGTSGWSTPRSVTHDEGGGPAPTPTPIVLRAPTLGVPPDGATDLDPDSVLLEWERIPGTIGYDVQIVPADQEWYEFGTGQPTTAYGPQLRSLDAGTTYKWRVRANATDSLSDIGPWSDEDTFTTAEGGTVSLSSPPDGAMRSNEALFFTWTALPNAPLYRLEIDSSDDFDDPTVVEAYADGRTSYPGKLAPGTWYWRVKAGRNQTAAISQVRTVTIVDTSPPVGVRRPINEYFLTEEITAHAPAEDAITEVEVAAASADGQTWIEFDPLTPPSWSLVTPEHGGPDEGPRQIWFKWKDTAGNWSAPSLWSFWYGFPAPDTQDPFATGPRIVTINPGAISSNGAVPVKIAWTLTDNQGLVEYNLNRKVDDQPCCSSVKSASFDLPPLDTLLFPGHKYLYLIEATDDGDNTTIATGPTRTLTRYTEKSSAIQYSGTWRTDANTAYWGGAARVSATAGAQARFTFTGRSVALVARRTPARGMAAIYVNGSKVATIDLYAPTSLDRQVVWSMDWSTSAARTVTVRVLGTPGRARFDLDGFVTVR